MESHEKCDKTAVLLKLLKIFAQMSWKKYISDTFKNTSRIILKNKHVARCLETNYD